MAKKQSIGDDDVPIQAPPGKPIQNSPYEEPTKFWTFNRITGEAKLDAGRRPAKYWYKTKQSAADMRAGQQTLLELDEGQEDLPVVNALRDDVRRWRKSGWLNTTPTTKELLRWWHRDPAGIGRGRRLFFCQLEAVETIVYLREVMASHGGPGFKPQFTPAMLDVLRDSPADPNARPLTRLGCKMATGSGKTVVMAMLIAWAFCNRGRNPSDERFPSAALAVCPNRTVRERLQVIRPDVAGNYYEAFDLVPIGLRPLLNKGRVLVTNWQSTEYREASPHSEGGKTFKIVDKGDESPDAYARRLLGDLYDRLPLMVLNDEAHHCYRPKPEAELTVEERREAKANAEDREEATRWVEGLDRINAAPAAKPGVAFCVDLSATPFYISGSGHAEGSPFPWLVSDFGLVDAIESGIVKIPRLPVSDATGRPEARYFRLWRHVVDDLAPVQRLPGRAGKPKPDIAYEKAQPALIQLAHQWQERFALSQAATPGQEKVPPVLIVVCDNTDIAEVFYRKISGESVADVVTLAEVDAELDDEEDAQAKRKVKTPKPKIVYGKSEVLDAFANRANEPQRTIRIDSKLLAEAESGTGTRQEAAEALRRVVSTVGKVGEPGEHVRCVVSVAMLTEGWDANNVTHIFGLRAFGSQLLCEQVVGRGLRRMDYTPDPTTGLLTEEYVDVYGVPFTVIPFKGREAKQAAPEDKPKQHVYALPERAHLEIRFPVVEGYAFALRRNLIKCDVDAMPTLTLQPNNEPTATYVLPQVGIQEGKPSQHGPFPFEKHDREGYYRDTHLQAIKFRVARLVLERLTADNGATKDAAADARRRVLRLQSRHQLFPQVLRFVNDYVARRVEFRGCEPAELGLEKYVRQMVERFAGDNGSILPNDDAGERPLMPILNRYTPIGTTANVDFKTTRPCHPVAKSHLNQAVLDTLTWESATAFKLDEGTYVDAFARNDELGLVIAYEFEGVPHTYRPDWIVKLVSGVTLLLETKGQETPKDEAKRAAAQKWVAAVNNWGEMGHWAYHVNYDPHRLGGELKRIVSASDG